MISFAEIEARAAERKGGADTLNALLIKPLPLVQLAAVPEDRWLAEMTRAIFQSGFSWELIDQRWPRFEDAFEGFSVTRWLFMSDDDLDRLLKAPGLVHNAMKLKSVAGNAKFLSDIAKEAGSAGQWFAGWPLERYMELCQLLKTRASRLGGRTGQYVMRRMGKDALILSSAVVKALIDASVVSGEPSSKKDFAAIQKAIDIWHAESGRGLTPMSQILAWSLP
ncbi:MAG: DNA-3-methyladenine glycosylase I [Asticcacaulis sp.]